MQFHLKIEYFLIIDDISFNIKIILKERKLAKSIEVKKEKDDNGFDSDESEEDEEVERIRLDLIKKEFLSSLSQSSIKVNHPTRFSNISSVLDIKSNAPIKPTTSPDFIFKNKLGTLNYTLLLTTSNISLYLSEI